MINLKISNFFLIVNTLISKENFFKNSKKQVVTSLSGVFSGFNLGKDFSVNLTGGGGEW